MHLFCQTTVYVLSDFIVLYCYWSGLESSRYLSSKSHQQFIEMLESSKRILNMLVIVATLFALKGN